MSTKISWTDETSNPLIAVHKENGNKGWVCVRVSDGCKNCYAATLNKTQRWGRGTGLDYTLPNLGQVEIRIDEPVLAKWFSMRKPRRVFVCSMTDLFGEFVPDALIGRILSHMIMYPHLTFQILTKRAERMLDVFSRWYADCQKKQLREPSNIWLGVSVENQQAADERIPLLLQTPVAIRFLSCEPLLGPIQFKDVPGFNRVGLDLSNWWVICGGESGPHFRPMNLDWARSIRDQCVTANVAFFFKQESAFRSETNPRLDGVEWHQYPHKANGE